MRRFIPTLLLLTLVAILAACGGGEGTKTPEDIHFGPQDTGPPPTPDARWDEPDTVEVVQPPDEKSEPDIPPVLTGCGDGECKGGETVENCAKDCLDTPEAAAFVFAHKGDELGALGRIYDLVQAGAPVYVFYLTFDDTPIDTIYAGAPSKLSVATLGVPAENIYLYETHIDWGLVTGSREVVDKLTQHFITLQPKTIYLPQLCGGELEDEMAHIAGIWAAKRAKIFPAYYEVPSPSNYYVGTAPDPATAQADPDAFVEQFVRRWKLIAKGTEELKPTLGSEDMVELRLAAAHIMNDWFQAFLYKLPEDRLLYLLREMQRFREVPAGQKSDKKPFTQSLDNPGAKFIYEEQGYTFDEFKQRAAVIQSFYGCNLRTEPSGLPFFDEPVPLTIMHNFDVVLDIRAFSPEPDTLTFKVGFGPSKNDLHHCIATDPVDVSALESLKVTLSCQAKQEVGEHTYYFRAYSKLAAENNDAALYTEVPFHVEIANF